ncbi:hypothetical protein E4U13_000273 [Claviceps humidiphila]|uniref:Uncharacterized protein n=1 Tax=Claviceps humidiphila TaxID=1294629 RepID=A0A9P7TZ03_9HYPO|nr:hypothetical protein E4U13_000273 [Claviceps humidiphila]
MLQCSNRLQDGGFPPAAVPEPASRQPAAPTLATMRWTMIPRKHCLAARARLAPGGAGWCGESRPARPSRRLSPPARARSVLPGGVGPWDLGCLCLGLLGWRLDGSALGDLRTGPDQNKTRTSVGDGFGRRFWADTVFDKHPFRGRACGLALAAGRWASQLDRHLAGSAR